MHHTLYHHYHIPMREKMVRFSVFSVLIVAIDKTHTLMYIYLVIRVHPRYAAFAQQFSTDCTVVILSAARIHIFFFFNYTYYHVQLKFQAYHSSYIRYRDFFNYTPIDQFSLFFVVHKFTIRDIRIYKSMYYA